MTSSYGLACAVSLACITCTGQTNVSTLPPARFFLAPVQLRSEAGPRLHGESPKPGPITAAEAKASTSAAAASLETGLGDGAFHSRVVREGEFYLARTGSRPDSAVGRFVDRVFTPEVIHIGKATVSCPIVTVIKRKDPLSLLSAISTRATPAGDGAIVYKAVEVSW